MILKVRPMPFERSIAGNSLCNIIIWNRAIYYEWFETQKSGLNGWRISKVDPMGKQVKFLYRAARQAKKNEAANAPRLSFMVKDASVSLNPRFSGA